MYEIRCTAPTKNPRRPGDTCRGFVATLPHEALASPVRHSRLIVAPSSGAACKRCGAVYELRPLASAGTAA